MDQFWSHRRSIQRQRRRSKNELRGTISSDGICAIDVARKSSRYRSVVGRQREQTLCNGVSSQHSSIDFGRCERVAQLAHLVRRCSLADSSSAQTLQRYRLGWFGLEEHGLRVGRHHDRLVFEPVRMGAVSQSQRCHKTAHAFGPARRYTSVYAHQRRKAARGQRARLHASRGWGLLRNGPRLFGFQATLQDALCGRFLCDTSQDQHERSTHLLGSSRPIDRHHLRSNGIAQRVLFHARLPRELEASSIQRPRERQDFDIFDQQFYAATFDDCSALQEPMASRTVLQMDQTASAHQEVSGQQRERRQDANLVRRVDLRSDCYRQKGTSN